MYRFIPLLVIATFILGCCPKKLTHEETAKEKQAVEAVAADYGKLVAEKNTQAILDLFSNSAEIMLIGTDSAEVFKSKDQFRSHLEVDWELLDVSKVGALRNVSTFLSSDGQMAATLYEVPWDLIIAGQKVHALIRFAMTMTKENNDWHIVQLLGQFATVGQSSEELLAQMKKAKK